MATLRAQRPKLGLETLLAHSDASLARLYASRWVCRAVFAQLSGAARAIILRLLFADLPQELVHAWTAEELDARSAFDAALAELRALRILRVEAIDLTGEARPRGDSYALCSSFRRGLSVALASVTQVPWQGVAYKLQPDQETTLEDVVGHMHTCWDNVLRYLVEEDRSQVPLSEEMQALVESPQVQLLVRNAKKKLELSQRGYEFLLKGVYMQVWEFIQVYLEGLSASRDTEREREEVLDLLYHLSYCRVGEAYHRNALSEPQRALLLRFRDLGLLYMRKKKSKRFYPTPLGVHLMAGSDRRSGVPSGAGKAEEPSHKAMRIIVQTNLKIIAYTSSPLHASMLGMFSEVRMKLPNMVLCELTRRSVKRAVEIGVHGKRIQDFLVSHAHPALLGREAVIPENVSDQIHLWESESQRVQFDAALYVDLQAEGLSEADFQGLLSEIKAKEVALGEKMLLWADAERRACVVRPHQETLLRRLLEDLRDAVVHLR